MASKLGDSFVGDEDEWDGGDDDFNESVGEYVESPVKRKRGPTLPWVLKKTYAKYADAEPDNIYQGYSTVKNVDGVGHILRCKYYRQGCEHKRKLVFSETDMSMQLWEVFQHIDHNVVKLFNP